MRILILTQYYPPEVGASQNRLSDLAKRLTKRGHIITVLTALPNYPKGEIFAEYRDQVIAEEDIDGIRVIRTWIYTTKNNSFVHRLLNYFSFVLSSLIGGIWKIRQQDVVVVESPPLFLGLSGFVISKIKRARLVFNVSDLWPESAIVMGVLNNKILIDLSERLEAFLYRKSDLITGQTQGIVNSIQLRFPSKSVALITNGINVEAFKFISQSNQEEEDKKEFGLTGKIVVGYAGLHGLAQGLETVLQAAQLLTGYQDIFFAFFGDGPQKEKLIDSANQAKLTNVCFYPIQPAWRMPSIIASFDIAIIPLKKLTLFKGALPSKMFEAMAAAVPIIVSIEGEAQIVVEKAQAGICVEPQNPEAMAEAILQLYKDLPYRKTLGQNGRRYVIEHYNRHQIALEFERLLLAISHAAID
jgi:glycosyltransferase involved in cell wall biosynthesis